MDTQLPLYRDIVLAVHGGAGGDITPENLPAERTAAYHNGLAAALRAGYERLRRGESALDAVEAAVRYMEDDPVFNAGRGASLAFDGTAELDASIMDGATRSAGAIAGVTNVKNPITLARAVMERSPYVMLTGPGAEQFAAEQNLPLVENSYFLTPERLAQLEHIRASGGTPMNTATVPRGRGSGVGGQGDASTLNTQHSTLSVADPRPPTPDPLPMGTVGAVALDKSGNLAAATSTGGMAGKRYGRVGDSPIIGAGTFAENATCAVSATGHGEYFIRWAAASDVAARMRYGGLAVDLAAGEVVLNVLRNVGGEGGIIALDAHGNAALAYNTPGMYRGIITASGEIRVGIFTALSPPED